MSELKLQAPLANFETDEWNEFNEYQGPDHPVPAGNITASDVVNCNNIDVQSNGNSSSNSSSVTDNFSENISQSLEDLVSSFDDTINNVFKNYSESTEQIAPVQIRKQEDILKDCQVWWTLTGNFGNILPIDWSKSHIRKLQTKALHLSEPRSSSPLDCSSSDEEDIRQQLDMHSLILQSSQLRSNSGSEDGIPCPTADQVIKEIERMMRSEGEEEDDDYNGADTTEEVTISDLVTPTDSAIDMMSPSISTDMSSSAVSSMAASATATSSDDDPEHRITTSTLSALSALSASDLSSPEKLSELSTASLNELFEEMECTIKEHSETLVHELALRDELEYEKETKNQFISLLLTVQKLRREAQQCQQFGGKIKKAMTPTGAKNGMLNSGTYLTTVIPYRGGIGCPSIEQLQIFIEILKAIKDDSPMVPARLTDYILKVLCPNATSPLPSC